MTSLKIDRLLPIYISIVPLKFGVDIQNQTKVRVWKPKNLIRLPGGGILKSTLLKINRLLHIYISIVPLKFGVDILKTKVRVWKTKKIQYGHQAAILKVKSLKINRLLPMTTINMPMKFEIEIPRQTWVTLRKPCHLQSPETEKPNMAARRPFWKWRCWKSIGSYPDT